MVIGFICFLMLSFFVLLIRSAILLVQVASGISGADVQQVLNAILHTADISNPTKTWVVSKKWSDRITKEYISQVMQSLDSHLMWEKWPRTLVSRLMQQPGV